MIKRFKKDWSWVMLFFSALIGVLLMIIYTFVAKTEKLSHKNNEAIIVWFYFTFLSNVIGLIVSSIRVFENIKGIEHKKYNILRLMATTSLIVTFLVYWGYLFPGHLKDNDFKIEAFNFTKTLFVHALTPIMMVVVFFYSNFRLKEAIKKSPWKESLFTSIYPFVWMIVAIIIYFALGGGKNSAIYSFLNFNEKPAWMFPAFFFGIGSLYFFTSLLLQVLENKIAIKI